MLWAALDELIIAALGHELDDDESLHDYTTTE